VSASLESRLVAAADAERRRIERTLHDGVQQNLVAIAVNLQLARRLGGGDSAALTELLDEIAADVSDALEQLRVLAHDIYPAVLVDRGLKAALGTLPATVDAGELGPHSPEIEGTVYFACSEAVRGAPPGTLPRVRAWEEPSAIAFEVAADGLGEGQQVIADRLAALGGQLEIAPGAISGRIPLAP
jgi:histidine kinase